MGPEGCGPDREGRRARDGGSLFGRGRHGDGCGARHGACGNVKACAGFARRLKDERCGERACAQSLGQAERHGSLPGRLAVEGDDAREDVARCGEPRQDRRQDEGRAHGRVDRGAAHATLGGAHGHETHAAVEFGRERHRDCAALFIRLKASRPPDGRAIHRAPEGIGHRVGRNGPRAEAAAEGRLARKLHAFGHQAFERLARVDLKSSVFEKRMNGRRRPIARERQNARVDRPEEDAPRRI